MPTRFAVSDRLLHLLRRKIALREAGDPAHEAIRPVLVVLGGAMRGVGGGAMAVAFHELGVAKAFEAVVGLSAGAPTAAYFAAGGQAPHRGTSIFYNILPPDFFRFSRYPWMDLPKLERAFREGQCALPPLSRWELNVPVWVGAISRDKKEPVWFRLQDTRDPVKYIVAACAVPSFWPNGVELPEGSFSDGELLFGKALPEFVASLRPTDVIVIANQSCTELFQPRGVALAQEALKRGLYCFVQFAISAPPQDKEILHMFLRLQRAYTREVIERLARLVPRVYVLWSPRYRVGRLTQDPKRLFDYARRSYAFAVRALGGEVREPLPLVPLRIP